jgi:predicted glycoside hydrolase/deacetylase ChbG (UPF0249 family)
MMPKGARKLTVLLLADLLVAGAVMGQSNASTLQERLGFPKGARLLILHADDLGMNHSVNRATFEALEKGWVNSASILVPCPWLPEVVRFAQDHPQADLGIHLALNSEWTALRWGPVSPQTEVPSLLDEQGYLPLVEETVVQNARPREVEKELRAQIQRARALGITPTHFDSHMGTLNRTAPLLAIYRRLGKENGLPIRLESEPGEPLPGKFPTDEALIRKEVTMSPGVAAKDWFAAYRRLLEPLQPGVYELVIHLAYDDEEMRGATSDHPDWGAAWRQSDFELVRSPQFRDLLHELGFTLVTWRDLSRALPSDYARRP